MAQAIAGGGDVLQPAVGAMDRDPRPGRRAGALEQLVQAEPQHLGELDQVGDRGHGLAALEPRQEAFRQAGLAGHRGQREASAGSGRAQAMADLLRGLGDLVHARQHGRYFLYMQVYFLAEKANKHARIRLKGTTSFCPLSGPWGMRKTMVTTRRSFLGKAGAGGLALVSGSAWAGPSIELPLARRTAGARADDGLPAEGHDDPAAHAAAAARDAVRGLRPRRLHAQ